MELVKIKESLEDMRDRLTKEIDSECPICNQIKKMLPVQSACDDCIIKMDKEESDRDAKKRLELQRIPKEYISHDLAPEYEYLIGKSVLINGEIGTGKTHLGCNLLKRQGGTFYSITELIERERENKGFLASVKKGKIIMVDNFGKLNPTDYALEHIFELFDYRYRENLLTIVTVDMTPEEIGDKYGIIGQALSSRFRQKMERVHLKKKWR